MNTTLVVGSGMVTRTYWRLVESLPAADRLSVLEDRYYRQWMTLAGETAAHGWRKRRAIFWDRFADRTCGENRLVPSQFQRFRHDGGTQILDDLSLLVQELERLLNDPDAVVRDAAEWAVERLRKAY